MENLNVADGISSVTYGDGFYAHVGMILPFAGITPPSGWLLCDGGTFSSSTYPELYSILGSTTLPDLKYKVLLGYDSNVPARGIGSNAGGGNHYHSISYPNSHPDNSTVFSTNSVTTNHYHNVAYNGITDDAQGNHGHNAAQNSATKGISNTGNYSQAAPTNAAVSTGNHGHTFGVGFSFGESVAHSHSINAVNTTALSPSHSHNYEASSTSGSIQNASNVIGMLNTVAINYIVKAG